VLAVVERFPVVRFRIIYSCEGNYGRSPVVHCRTAIERVYSPHVVIHRIQRKITLSNYIVAGYQIGNPINSCVVAYNINLLIEI